MRPILLGYYPQKFIFKDYVKQPIENRSETFNLILITFTKNASTSEQDNVVPN